ncbi:hypothetical protein V6615_03750 [Oscillospiraceae bacterium PP1C4]
MKIGVAFSGSGIGAASAHVFAEELRKCSLAIEMLSVTSLAAVPSLLWTRGIQMDTIAELMNLFSAEKTPYAGLKMLERMGAFQTMPVCNLAVNSVDAATGISVIYSDIVSSDAWNLKVLPLTGNESVALSSTISPYKGSESFSDDGMQLCDFAIRYGCPFFPLKMAGMERLLSVSFAGGDAPAQIAADSLSSLTGKNADLHYTVKLIDVTDTREQIQTFVQEHIAEIYDKMLF